MTWAPREKEDLMRRWYVPLFLAILVPGMRTAGADAIVLEVDAESGAPGAQTVALGSTVSMHVVSETEQEFHLHDYDVENSGTDVTLTFVADHAGSFALESHEGDTLLFTLVVE
mgnify:CR=1 FL=1